MNAQILRDAGINYEAGLAHFLDDVYLYEAVLAAFVNDNAFERAGEAYRSGDKKELNAIIHEIKGSCGNANFMNIYEAAEALLTLLRSGLYSNNELAEKYSNFEKVYFTTRVAVKKALEG